MAHQKTIRPQHDAAKASPIALGPDLSPAQLSDALKGIAGWNELEIGQRRYGLLVTRGGRNMATATTGTAPAPRSLQRAFPARIDPAVRTCSRIACVCEPGGAKLWASRGLLPGGLCPGRTHAPRLPAGRWRPRRPPLDRDHSAAARAAQGGPSAGRRRPRRPGTATVESRLNPSSFTSNLVEMALSA